MNKKLLSILIVLVMFISPVSSAFANPTQNKNYEHNEEILSKKQEVVSILDKLAEYKLEQIEEDDHFGLDSTDSYVAELESRLRNLGGRKLSQNEIQEIKSSSDIDNTLSDATLSSTDWWEY